MPQSLGELLRQIRTERGKTLQEVAFATRVHQRYLEALEADDRAALPSAVQARGFLRLIAGYLGVNPQLFLDAWDGKLTSEPPEQLSMADSGAAPSGELLLEAQPPANEPPSPSAPTPTTEIVTTTPPPAPLKKPRIRRSAAETLKTIPLFRGRAEEEAEQESIAASAAQAAAAQAIFRRIGQQLRQQREALSLNLSDVSQHTHIRENNLLALEEGRITDIASPVQARGMLSNLADFLNLDREDLLLQFAEALQLVRQSKFSTPAPSSTISFGRPRPEPNSAQAGPGAASTPAKRRRYWVTPDLLIASVVLIGMVTFIVWGVSQILSSPDTTTASAPSISDVLLISGSVTPEPLASQTSVAETPVPAQPGAEVVIADTQTPPALPTSNAPVQINVVARERAFLRITADGKEQFNGRIAPGNVYSFSASQRLDLLCGSATAIEVYYNGSSLGDLGVVGQVVNLIFTLNGLQTPTPAFTATPTATLPATLTPRPTATLPAPTITPLVP